MRGEPFVARVGQNPSASSGDSARSSATSSRPLAPFLVTLRRKKKNATPDGVAFSLLGVEPPIGIEPMTYSLRVNRSAD